MVRNCTTGRGVVGAIGPWNWPMMISVWQLAPSLRMGNTVVLKPSEYTPLSVLALAHVLNTALPDDVLHVVSGGREVGEALVAHPHIDKLMFTGSTETGKAIIRSSADTVKRLTLELGGNDAGIVLPDVDPASIAEDLFWGAFINTGQTCAALKRLYVHEDVYDDVVEALAGLAAAMPMGVGIDESNVLGPLQNKASTTSSLSWSKRRRTTVHASSSAGIRSRTSPGTSTRRPWSPTSTTRTRSSRESSSVRSCRSSSTRRLTKLWRWPTTRRRVGSIRLVLRRGAGALGRRPPAGRHRVDQQARRSGSPHPLRRCQAVGVRLGVRCGRPQTPRPAPGHQPLNGGNVP